MIRVAVLLSLGTLAVKASLSDEDTSTLVQVQHQGKSGPPLGQTMTLTIKASASQREGATVDCAGCYETGFDLTCMGRSLTYVFLPNTLWARIDGKMADQRIGWRPAMDVEHIMTVTLRSSDIHTFCITDGQDNTLKWCKDFHHTGYFPITNTDRYRCRIKTTDEKYMLNRPIDRKKCYVSESERHCLHAPTDFVIQDETEPYESEYIDHPRTEFSHCQAWGDPHYVRFPPNQNKKLNFQGLGTYWMTSLDRSEENPNVKVQVFNCRMTKSRAGTITTAAAISMRGQRITINGNVVKVNGEVKARGLWSLRRGVELDVSPRFVIVKGPTNMANGFFAEVKVMIRKSRNSPTGYLYSVFSYLPSESVDASSGMCTIPGENNKRAAAAQFVSASNRFNLFDAEDLTDLESTCCDAPGCAPPTNLDEPEPSLEELCAKCPSISIEQAEAFCDEFSDRASQLLYHNCKYDVCVSCDPLESMAETELEFSEEIDGEPVGVFGPLMPVGARADPHCSNVRGENFDIRTRGHHEMIEIPRSGETRGKSLDVSALIAPIGSDPCSPTVIERLDVRGSWLPGNMALSLKPSVHGVPEIADKVWSAWQEHGKNANLTLDVQTWDNGDGKKSVMTVKVYGVTLVVHQRKGTHSGKDYLDLEVKGLGDYEDKAGGLLGLDSHKAAAKAATGCHVHDPKVVLSEGTEFVDGRLLSQITVS